MAIDIELTIMCKYVLLPVIGTVDGGHCGWFDRAIEFDFLDELRFLPEI